ncbi:MAG TPA: bestrophin family ion channel [Marmoricola sp.]|nr:bestrophin family ion channel [Marmoricola sp.]
MALTAGCSPLGSGDGPSGVLDEFTRAVAKGDLSESLFSEPSVAAYQKVVAGMGSDPVVSWSDVEQEGDRSTATLTWHWSMPGSTWVYRSKAHLVRTEPDGEDARWRIEFRPDLVEPSLKPEEVLVEQSIQPPRAEILAGDGTALVTERPVARVGLDKTKVTDQADLVATANQLARAVGIKPDDYLALAQKMEASLDGLAAAQGGCERIAGTPLPFTYSVILHRSAYLYCMLLPFGLVDAIGIMTPLVVTFVSYTFFALEALSDEIEEPFGLSANDLALDAIVANIDASLRELLGESPPPAPRPDHNFILT